MIPSSLRFIVLLLLGSIVALAQDTQYVPRGPAGRESDWRQIPGPKCLDTKSAWEEGSSACAAEEHQKWLADISHWRDERRIRIGYDGSRYDLTALRWTQSSFIQPQMMVHDRFFYDATDHRYTVDRYVDDTVKRYGGIDAVLIWSTYPNMGMDNRNQLDMVRSMPGGIPGVRQMVADFHHRNVRVFFPMMMWDQGTRDPGKSWPDAIASLMSEIGADGVNGDTQDGVPRAFSEAAERIGHTLAFEPEHGPHDEGLAYNLLTWADYKFPLVPLVDRFKWLEPRHMVNISDRWNRTKTDDLQFAFFNGVGWESWENIWGIWNGISPRDGEATRRVATIERGVAPFLVSKDWEPFFPMQQFGVFASRWPLGNQTVWTIVNRNEYGIVGPQIELPAVEGMHYFDLYHGVELAPERQGDQIILKFAIDANDYGALFASKSPLPESVQQLLTTMRTLSAIPLSSFAH
jgi:iron(II)-dependent oxidoreductase